MGRIRYFIELVLDRDRIRVDFQTASGRVTRLHVVQYETKMGDQWQPVARYDAAHGFLHIDLYTKGKPTKYHVPVDVLSDAVTLAIEDLKANWRTYKSRCSGAKDD